MNRGDFVRIASGSFAGMTGVVDDTFGDRVTLRLTSTGRLLTLPAAMVQLDSRATSPTERTEEP